jgi:hypothetical protein
MGHDLRLSDGAGAARQDRSRFPEAGLRQAHVEFRLVDQPQGPLWQEPLRRRVSRARQHRGLRPQCTIAHRRIFGTGRRHRLGRPVLPEYARDRLRTRRARPDLSGPSGELRRRVPADRPSDERDRSGRDVGRGGRLLLRRPPLARRKRYATQGPLDGGSLTALRRYGGGQAAARADPPASRRK